DQQVTIQFPNAAGNNVASFVTNAGDSRILGFEAEARANLTDDFSISGMFGYTNADFREVVTNAVLPGGAIGEVDVSDIWNFQNTPAYTFAINPTWSYDLGGSGKIQVSPSMSYRSAYQMFEVPNP